MRRFRRPKRWSFNTTKYVIARESGEGQSFKTTESAVGLLRYYARFAEELRMRAWKMHVIVYPHIKLDFYTTHNEVGSGMRTTLWSEDVCAQMDEGYTERFIVMLDELCRRYRMGWWVTEGGIFHSRMTLHFSRDEILGTRRARESDINPGYGESNSDDPHDEFGQCFG